MDGDSILNVGLTEAREALSSVFGHADFRGLQAEVIAEVQHLLGKANTRDDAYRLVASIPHRLRRLSTSIVPYVLKDQSAFAQNLAPVTEAVRHDDL